MPNIAPSDLTHLMLTHARGKELKFWVDEANRVARKKLLTKVGTVGELREWLAAYYEIDLSSAPPTVAVAGPSTCDTEIQKRQWAHLRYLGEEWKAAPGSFQLCDDSGTSPVLHPQLHLGLNMAIASSAPDCTLAAVRAASSPSFLDVEMVPPETVHAWLQAVKNGDVGALTMLLKLQGTIQSVTSQMSLTSNISPPLAFPAPPTTPPTPTATPLTEDAACRRPLRKASVQRGDAAILASGEPDIEALNRASNLCDVINQVEHGDVKRIREKYGPLIGRAANPIWSSIKNTINHREKLYEQLTSPHEFAGSKDRFYVFFTTACNTLPQARKRKSDGAEDEMVPFRLVAEAIPHRNKDIQEEKRGIKYFNMTGSHSVEIWRAQWGNMNDWEVWRALGKEHYKR